MNIYEEKWTTNLSQWTDPVSFSSYTVYKQSLIVFIFDTYICSVFSILIITCLCFSPPFTLRYSGLMLFTVKFYSVLLYRRLLLRCVNLLTDVKGMSGLII